MYSSSIQARNHSTIGGSEVTTLLCDGEKRELSSTTVTTSVHEFFYWLDPRRKYPDISFTSGVGRGGAYGARAPPLYLRLYKKCTQREGSCSS